MKALNCWLITSLLAASAVQAGTDCSLGARYMALSRDRITAGANDEAVGFLNHAIEVCPSYEAYQALGELEAQSPEQADQFEAAKAFVAAYDLAPDDQAKAKTQFEYAKLLARNGEQQKAYPMAKSAHALDRNNAQISALAEQLEEQIRHPTRDQLVRGFLQNALYMPLHMAAVSAPVAVQQQGGRAVPAPAPPPTPQPPAANGLSVVFPINFDTATTVVDKRTWPNIATLAHALADPKLAGHRFAFIGHADIRGDDESNMRLSRERAAAMYRDVILVEPALQGRIDIDGRGSREPLDPGTSEEALRANRRLQVSLK
jgi:outer membrane protein OmpA-like peptidoglycan-associated protein